MFKPQNEHVDTLCFTLRGDSQIVDWCSIGHWHELLSATKTERVSPLLYQAFHKAGWPEGIPDVVRDELRRAYFTTTTSNILICRELSRIASALRGDSLATDERPRVLLLKGIALALSLYPSIGLRPMDDVDLLVPPHYLDSVLRSVTALGYREKLPEIGPGLRRVIGHAVPLRGGPDNRLDLELHWGLVAGDLDRRSPALNWFWEQTEDLDVTGTDLFGPGCRQVGRPLQFYQLTPTAHLLYLAAHLLLQHENAHDRLLWYYDMHLILTRWEKRLEWNELLKRAREFGWTTPLRAALEGTRERFATALPRGIFDALGGAPESKTPGLETLVHTRATRFWRELQPLAWRARFVLLWGHIFPSPAYLRWRYQPERPWLWPLCYPYRWSAIFWEASKTITIKMFGSRRWGRAR